MKVTQVVLLMMQVVVVMMQVKVMIYFVLLVVQARVEMLDAVTGLGGGDGRRAAAGDARRVSGNDRGAGDDKMRTVGAARPASRDERRVDGVEWQAETGQARSWAHIAGEVGEHVDSQERLIVCPCRMYNFQDV